MIPVIYIHFGNIPQYLVTSIDCATRFNKEIILITDTDFKHDKVKCYSLSSFTDGLNEFESVYTHMSSNTAEFEKMCIARWFILRNFINKEKIDLCYYSDSDVMIYADLTETYKNYSAFDSVYTFPEYQEKYLWAASACCSYWKNNCLNRFCEFIMNLYSTESKSILEEKWNFHLKNKIPGGICDMTLLYLFAKEINIFSLSKVINKITFDQNTRVASNYYMNEYNIIKPFGKNTAQKKITWRNGLPFAYNNILKSEIRFVALTEYAKLIGEKKSLFNFLIEKAKNSGKKIKKSIENNYGI